MIRKHTYIAEVKDRAWDSTDDLVNKNTESDIQWYIIRRQVDADYGWVTRVDPRA